ncbi:RING finger domain protein [Metarhizium album ARSEF 1941]|uniref:RING finger domain protein n=1 Tax=Metarhizium album (strain ARSEF 1941) TaxID=1081103 RepID=A0A0B2WYH2_METAS|nr:RING finger domain protein [Metarhizium album ARSEF 1941]KHN98634.1 RING finger domain protein [Metarhizium album ARSEF 1941]
MASTDKGTISQPETLQAAKAEKHPHAPRRCFICLTDDDPSDPPGSWVDPCPCTLEAHQDCMLSWVTDCERNNKPLQCPVCKSTIEMEGAWDMVVALNEAVRNRFTRASPLILFTGVSMGVQFSLQMYGALALWSFAGKDTMMRFLLGPEMVIDARSAGGVRFLRERIWNALVLMNVAPTLLISRLLPNLSNKIFLPSASLYGMYQILHDDTFLSWPPSPRLALAVFPYVRSLYYNFWREFVLPYEIKLNREIIGLPPIQQNEGQQDANQRRQAQRNQEGGLAGLMQGILDALDMDEEEDDPQFNDIEIMDGEIDANGNPDADAELMIELRIEELREGQEPIPNRNEIGGELHDNDDGEQQGGQAHEPANRADGAEPAQARGDEGVQENEVANAAEGQVQVHHEVPQAPPVRRVGLGALLSGISNAVVGALILPGVSFAMGEALRLALPKTWTSSGPRSTWTPYSGATGRPGLLQQQWGRSLVGGCLFVVLKDVVRVYAKSRRVAALSSRRVKNVDRKRGEK